jgi:hypothetical protein
MDTVTMQEAEEFSQLHLGEQILRATEISEEEYLTLFDKDNDYLKSWNSEKKTGFIHDVKYEEDDALKEAITL